MVTRVTSVELSVPAASTPRLPLAVAASSNANVPTPVDTIN